MRRQRHSSSLCGRRVLVTGSNGFLGSRLIERLLAEGANVGGLSRNVSTGRLVKSPSYSFIRCDLTDAEAARRAIASFAPQVLFHFAAHADGSENFKQVECSIQGNLISTVNVLEGFRLSGGDLFVYGDSCKVYGNSGVPYREVTEESPISSYAITKLAAWGFCESYARLYGMATASVRPTLIYGPRQSHNIISFVIDCVLAGKPQVRLDGGVQTRDPLFIDDAVEAFMAIARIGARAGGRIVNIGGGREISVSNLAKLIVALMDSEIPVVSIPMRARPTEMWRSYCDNVEAGEILGWRPSIDLEAGLSRTIHYLVEKRREHTAGDSRRIAGVGRLG